MGFLKRSLLLFALAFTAGNAWAASGTCWTITGYWKMCSEGRVQEFHPGKSEPFFAAMHDGQFVASGWTFKEHPEDIVRLGDRALWRKIKLKLIADLEEMGQDYRSVTRHGVEFIEWSLAVGDHKNVFSHAMIENLEAFVSTVSTTVPADYDIVAAHEVFMTRTKVRPND